MLLGFKTIFPNGEPTNFKEKILSGEKIHTIRLGNRWEPGMKIHFATDIRTKQCDIFKVGECVSVQKIEILHFYPNIQILIDGNSVYQHYICGSIGFDFFKTLCKNDGLTTSQFDEWFGLYQDSARNFEGQIVHWTDFNY